MEEAVAFFGIIAVALFIDALIHVAWFRWIIIIDACVFAYVKWIYPKKHASNASEKVVSSYTTTPSYMPSSTYTPPRKGAYKELVSNTNIIILLQSTPSIYFFGCILCSSVATVMAW